jgi:release factor glutamine methyltransferase
VTRLQDILALAISRLAAAGCDTPRLDAEVLLAHSLSRERTWLYLYPEYSLTPEQVNTFEALLRRREAREPVAYLIGCKEFFGLEFQVNPHVLIPRPETELLVETALQIYDLRFTIYDFANSPRKSKIVNRKLTIVDVGTGSGCIATALAKYLPQAAIFAIDTSAKALQLARRNAERHSVAGQITFLPGDLLQPLIEPVDLIVSNPPYVSEAQLAAASPEVSRFEPRLALAGGADGLAVIRRLLAQAAGKLNPGGSLLIEIGSSQGVAVKALAQTYFPAATIRIESDLAGLDRLLIVQS